MAVTISSRPQGHKQSITPVQATALRQVDGKVFLFSATNHGLNDGDFIYIESDIESYNGYKSILSQALTSFKLVNDDGQQVDFKQQVVLNYYKTVLNHGWQCAHLPIVYNLHSDKLPNTVDPLIAVTSSGAVNGNLYVIVPTLAINPLDYITLITDQGPKVHQIISVVTTSDTKLVLNVSASAYTTITSIQRYYNNYFVTVEVWAGLESGHAWVAEKPFGLAATLKFIPDSSGNIKFSISEILKGYIFIKNNLLQDSLPNNIDFLTEFYIKINENYDTSDGTTVTAFAGAVTDDGDNFTGQAVNAKMPFKSVNQGFISDYITSSETLARWLTTQDRPQCYVDRFFDLSFINTYLNSNIIINILKKLRGAILDTDTVTYANPGSGVLRIPVTAEAGYDEFCIQGTVSGSSVMLVRHFENVIGPGVNWVSSGGSKKVTLTGIGVSDLVSQSFVFTPGVAYTITVVVALTGSAAGQLTLQVTDSANVAQFSQVNSLGSSPQTITLSFTATANTKNVALMASRTSSAGPTRTVTLTSVSVAFTTLITEQICIDIVDECQTFLDDNLRLTEDVRLRELE